MKRYSWPMIMLAILALLLANCAPPQVTEEPVIPESQCVDFHDYPDDATPGRVFQISGFRFTALGANEPFVNDIDTGVHGLAFDSDGIQVDLPRPASTVSLTAGSYTAEPLEITALDGDGNVVDQTTVPADNSVHTISLTGQEITSVIITGGGFEGVLVEICIDTEPELPTETDVTPSPAQCQYPFDTFPGDIPFSDDTPNPSGTWQSLNGDEFSEWGFLVASTPVADCAIVKTSYYSSPNNYLALLSENPCLGAKRIEITFLEPVRQVALAFSGASINYVMEVYDQAGTLLGSPIQEAEFDEEGRLFTVSFRSDSANISRIRFGYLGTAAAVVAIREINICDSGRYNAPDWFTDRGNLGHTASTNSSIALPLSERWRVNLGGGVRSSVIGAFGMLYVGADDNTMYALSPQDGSVQWTFQANGKPSSTGTAVGENKDESKFLWFTAEDGNLYALDAENGNLLWTVSGSVGTFNSATNYASGIVYYTYMSGGVSSKTRAVNGTSGEIVWESSSFNITVATPMHGAGRLFQGLTQGGTVFRAYNPVNGEVDWEVHESQSPFAAAYTSGVIDTDVGVGNSIRIYVSVRGGSIRAIESMDGQTIWETELSGNADVGGIALSQNRSTNTLIVSQNADLYALEPSTGSIVWHIQHSGNYIDPTTRNTPMPAIYGDYVFHIEDSLYLAARRLGDGTEAWRVELDAYAASSPTVGGETVYIATSSGAVYAFSP